MGRKVTRRGWGRFHALFRSARGSSNSDDRMSKSSNLKGQSECARFANYFFVNRMSIGHLITPWPPREISDVYHRIPQNGKVLDIGCVGFKQVKFSQALGMNNLEHFGVDYCPPEGGIPAGFTFKQSDLNEEKLPYPDDFFDLVVASHVIEHLSK